MQDGYYLSTFLVEGKLQCALDIKLRHDQTVALWEKHGDEVSLIRYWELERFSGWKQHTYTFFSKKELYSVIDFLLDTVGIKRSDILEIWGTPSIDTAFDYIDESKYNGIGYHNICHLFSAYLCDQNKLNEDYLIMALDSGPESIAQFDAYHKLYYSGAYCHNHDISIFPIQSPGKLWSNSKKRFGLREGTLMALASACSAKINVEYDKNVNLTDELALEEALEYLDGLAEHIDKVGFSVDDRFSREENYISAFMKQVNKKTQEIVSNNVMIAIEKYGIDCKNTVLCLAGGFTLNCPTNTYLMDKFHFKRLQMPPCANDSGEALGIGLLTFYQKMHKEPVFSISSAFCGADIDDIAGNTFADAFKEYGEFILETNNFSPITAAEDIRDNIVVWVQGRAEIGPRALGHRSILGNPCRFDVKDRLNIIKGRQWWRPVAPIILEERVKEVFVQGRKSPYMLEAFAVKEEWKKKIPSVVHLDGTARVQTITCEDNKLLYEVIEEFEKLTSVPVICNTSLNDKGEPIIQTVSQAIEFCLRKHISILYVNGMRILLRTDKEIGDEGRRIDRKPDLFFHLSENEISCLNDKYNPFGLNKDVLTYYYDNPEILSEFDITKKADCEQVIRKAELFMKKNGISLRRDIL